MTKDHTWKLFKTQCFLIQLLQKLNYRYALIVVQISRQSNKARTSYSDLKGVAKRRKRRRKKNTKKIRRTLKAHISWTARWIQLKFGIGDFVSLLREFRTTDAWKRHFLHSCKIHTCLSHTQVFLVSWAVRHTTVCLDVDAIKKLDYNITVYHINSSISKKC